MGVSTRVHGIPQISPIIWEAYLTIMLCILITRAVSMNMPSRVKPNKMQESTRNFNKWLINTN